MLPQPLRPWLLSGLVVGLRLSPEGPSLRAQTTVLVPAGALGATENDFVALLPSGVSVPRSGLSAWISAGTGPSSRD